MESSMSLLCLAVTFMMTALPPGCATSCEYQLFRPSSRYDGYIMSPNYPQRYPSGICLMWVYYGRPGMHISIRLLDVDIPTYSSACSNDFLMIGPLNEHTYCGSIDNQSFELYEAHLTNMQYWLFVVLNSTYVETKGRGFKLYYQFSNTHDRKGSTSASIWNTTPPPPTTTARPPWGELYNVTASQARVPDTSKDRITTPQRSIHGFLDECIFQMNDQSGEINSDYLISAIHYTGYCSWLLHMQPTDGHPIVYKLTFERFQLSGNSMFKVYDGGNMSAPTLGTYFSVMPPFSLTSSQNSVLVYYTPGTNVRSASVSDAFTLQYNAVVKCPLGYEACGYGEFSCFREENRCDGLWHCPLHGGDERGCAAVCPTDFSCDLRSSNCYRESDRCNGKGTCSNYMDEIGCSEDRCSADKGLFLCRNGRCVYEKWRCDKMNDCLDNSDEEDCHALSSPRVIVAAVVGSLSCALLLVIAVGCVCKVYHMRVHQLRGGPHHETPLSRQLAEMFHHRAPPPPYHEAMLTSRPYDEAYLELLGQTENHLEVSGVSNDQNANPVPPGERPLRSNRRGTRRCRHNQRHPNLGQDRHQSQVRTETERLVENETLPFRLEAFDSDLLRRSSSSAGLTSNSEPPPYSEGDPSLRAETYCSDSDDEFSENETWHGDLENAGYVGDEDSRASIDGEPQQMGVIPPATIWRATDFTSLSSGLSLRNFNGIRIGPERNVDDPAEDDDSNKDGDNASTSLSVDSQRRTADEDNKTQQHLSVIDEDSDSDCILDGNNVDDASNDNVGDDTDSDTVCILDHA